MALALCLGITSGAIAAIFAGQLLPS